MRNQRRTSPVHDGRRYPAMAMKPDQFGSIGTHTRDQVTVAGGPCHEMFHTTGRRRTLVCFQRGLCQCAALLCRQGLSNHGLGNVERRSGAGGEAHQVDAAGNHRDQAVRRICLALHIRRAQRNEQAMNKIVRQGLQVIDQQSEVGIAAVRGESQIALEAACICDSFVADRVDRRCGVAQFAVDQVCQTCEEDCLIVRSSAPQIDV